MSSDILGDPGAVNRGGKNGATEFFKHRKTGFMAPLDHRGWSLGHWRNSSSKWRIFPPSPPPPCSFDMLGSTIASSKLSTHPSPNSTLTQTSKRMAKCQVNGGAGGDLCRDIKTYANPFPSLTLKLTSLVCNKCRVKGGVGGPFTRISYSQYYCLG